jgi:hypothetical protein
MMEWHSAEKADRNRLDMTSTDLKGYKADKRIRVLKELQMYNSLKAKEKSAHNRKMLSVTVAGPWPIYDNDNDKQVRVKGSHREVEAAKIKIDQAVKKRDVKRRQMELQAQITDKAMREANQRIFLDQKQMATNG